MDGGHSTFLYVDRSVLFMPQLNYSSLQSLYNVSAACSRLDARDRVQTHCRKMQEGYRSNGEFTACLREATGGEDASWLHIQVSSE